jgi:hypothetical protein
METMGVEKLGFTVYFTVPNYWFIIYKESGGFRYINFSEFGFTFICWFYWNF